MTSTPVVRVLSITKGTRVSPSNRLDLETRTDPPYPSSYETIVPQGLRRSGSFVEYAHEAPVVLVVTFRAADVFYLRSRSDLDVSRDLRL